MKNMPKIKNLFPRSVSIHANKSYIYGSPCSGKTSLAFFYASQFQHVLYYNLDMLISNQSQNQAKQSFLARDSDNTLIILDNFYRGFLQDMTIHAPCILIGKREECPNDFTPLRLLALSFEENLSFDTKNLSIESLFANFIRDGNNPDIYFLTDFKKYQRKWEIMKMALGRDFEIFYYLLSLQSRKLSTYAIYTYLKQYVKISKDKLYAWIESLHNNSVIHICKHIDEVHSPTVKKYKLYLYDFSLSEFSDSKHFMRMYENMVFLELLAMDFTLVYSDFSDFIDIQKEMIFLCMPFASLENIQHRISLVRKHEELYKSFRIIVVSMNNNQDIDSLTMIVDFTNLSFIREQ